MPSTVAPLRLAKTTIRCLTRRRASTPPCLRFKDDKGSTWDGVIKANQRRYPKAVMYNRWIDNRRARSEKLSRRSLGLRAHPIDGRRGFRTTFSDGNFGRYNQKEGIIIDTRFNGGGRIRDIKALFSGTKYLEQVPRGHLRGLH